MNFVTGDNVTRIATVTTRTEPGLRPFFISRGKGQLSCVVKGMPLAPGKYLIKGGISCGRTKFTVGTIGWDNAPVVLSVDVPDRNKRDTSRILEEINVWNVRWE